MLDKGIVHPKTFFDPLARMCILHSTENAGGRQCQGLLVHMHTWLRWHKRHNVNDAVWSKNLTSWFAEIWKAPLEQHQGVSWFFPSFFFFTFKEVALFLLYMILLQGY